MLSLALEKIKQNSSPGQWQEKQWYIWIVLHDQTVFLRGLAWSCREFLPTQTHQNQQHHAPQPMWTIPTESPNTPAWELKGLFRHNAEKALTCQILLQQSRDLSTNLPALVWVYPRLRQCHLGADSFYFPVVSPPAPPPARPISEFNTWCRSLGRDERCFLTSNLVKSVQTLASH